MNMTQENIIVVHYINTKGFDVKEIEKMMDKIASNMPRMDGVMNYIIPIREGDTRIECINPRLLTEAEFESTRAVLAKFEDALKNIIAPKQES